MLAGWFVGLGACAPDSSPTGDPGATCVEVTETRTGASTGVTTVIDAAGHTVAQAEGAWHEDWVWDGDDLLETYRWCDRQLCLPERTQRTYDGDRQLIEVTVDEGDDGGIEHRTTFTWTDGRLGDEVARRGDRVEYRGTYRYDDDGQLVWYRREPPGTHRGASTWTYTWLDGLLASETFDDADANGDRVEQHTTWTYDADGHELTTTIDDTSDWRWGAADGHPDSLRTSTWRAGLRTRRVEERPVGTPRVLWTWAYDDHGRPIREEERELVDGAPGDLLRASDTTYREVRCP